MYFTWRQVLLIYLIFIIKTPIKKIIFILKIYSQHGSLRNLIVGRYRVL